MTGTNWVDRALCSQIDPEIWFPEIRQSNRAAKLICGSPEAPNCPVREECLEYALRTDQRYGVWGGLSEMERREVRRGRQHGPFVPHVASQNREHAAYMKDQQDRRRDR